MICFYYYESTVNSQQSTVNSSGCILRLSHVKQYGNIAVNRVKQCLTRRYGFSCYAMFSLLLIPVFLLTSCATSSIYVLPTLVPTTPAHEIEIPAYSQLLILQPVLKFERLNDEVILDSSGFAAPAIKSKLYDTARNAAAESNTQIVEVDTLSTDKVDLYSRLQSLSPMLSTGHLNNEARKYGKCRTRGIHV